MDWTSRWGAAYLDQEGRAVEGMADSDLAYRLRRPVGARRTRLGDVANAVSGGTFNHLRARVGRGIHAPGALVDRGGEPS